MSLLLLTTELMSRNAKSVPDFGGVYRTPADQVSIKRRVFMTINAMKKNVNDRYGTLPKTVFFIPFLH